MNMRETDVKEMASQDHEVLGSDFCSGYTDIFGKWNTGFECPRVGGDTVYCCGTVTYKYCCTRRDHHGSSGISQSVLLGSALGSVLVILLVTLVSCFICRRCVPYRRQHPSLNGGPLYTMQCSSTVSGMYPSSVTTPIDVLLDHPNHGFSIHTGLGRHLSPVDPPPPYIEANPTEEQTTTASNSFDLRESNFRSQQRQLCADNSEGCEANGTQNNRYGSTKF